MRKHFCGIAILCLLALAGLVTSHCVLLTESKDVTVQETTILGDVSTAEGLTAKIRSQYHHRLFWDTTFSLGGEAETDFRASIQPDYPSELFQKDRTYLSLQLHSGYEALDSSIDHADLSPLQLAVAEYLEGKIAPRATLQTSLPMADFTDCYPANFHLAGDNQRHDQDFQQFVNELNSSFQFPLLREEFILVSAQANAGGKLCKLDINTTMDQRVSQNCVSCVSQDILYFVPEVRLEDGTLLDYSNTPNGYGVYTLPIGEKKPTIEDLHFFTPLDESCPVMDLAVTGDQRSLLLVTGEVQPQLLHFDLESAAQVQTLLLPAADRTFLFCEEERLLTMQSNDHFQFFTKETDGNYRLQLSGSAPSSGDDRFPILDVNATAWNGKKLALLATDWYRTDTITKQPLTLLICDASGTLYTGELDSSLNRCQYLIDPGEGPMWQNYCDYLDSDPYDLTWN